MTVAVICSALLGILLFALGMGVSLTRQKAERGIGASEDPTDPLHKIVRAHANTTEYAPMLAVLMLYLGASASANWVLWVMALTTLCRFLIVYGLMFCKTLNDPHPMRFVGALGTYLGGLILSVMALLTVI